MSYNGSHREVTLEVIPLRGPSARENLFLVLFIETPQAASLTKVKGRTRRGALKPDEAHREISRLKYELEGTRKHLQSMVEEQEVTNEELRSANEEILSSNEELQSTNEEMETAREELQSTNEELTTLNEELQNSNLELNAANNDLLNILNNVAIPILILGEDLRIRRFTPAAEKVFNIIPADTGRRLSDLRLGIEVPDLEQMIVECIDSVGTKEREVQDREGHWYLLQARPYKTVENQMDGAVLTLVDIHALKRALDQQMQTLDLAKESIFKCDLAETVTYWNRGAERLYGWKQEEVMGKNPHVLLATAFPRGFVEIREQLFRDEHWEGEVVHTAKDGGKIKVQSRWSLQRDEAGKPAGFLQINEDVTERERAEEALRVYQKRYWMLFERNLAAIFQASPEGQLMECNDAFLRVFGFSTREEAREGEAWGRCFSPGDLERLIERLRAERTVTGLSLEMRRKDGDPVSVIMNATLLEAESGEPGVVEGIVLDVTDRKKKEESLRQLSARLFEIQDEERQRIAHELHDTTGAGLAALSLSLAELEGSASMDDAARESLSQSVALAKQCAREIRTFSYLLHPPLMHDFGLVPALRWYVEGFAERSGIEVRFAAPDRVNDLPRTVEAAVFRLVQECLSNVHRHSGSKTAEVRIAPNDHDLAVEVKDAGHGMPRDVLEETPGRTRGLGLIGMRQRIEALGGRLQIRSTTKGTAIRAVLPTELRDG